MEAPSWDNLSPQPPAAAPNWNALSDRPGPQPSNESPQENPSGPPAWEDLKTPEEMKNDFGGAMRSFSRAAESGFSVGLSNIGEGEATKQEQEMHPVADVLGNLLGTGALLTATGGLGLEAKVGASLLTKASLNAAQAAIVGAGHAVTNDIALGDPNLTASKLASDVGTSALWSGLLGGAGTVVLSGGSSALSGLTSKVLQAAAPDLSMAPEALGPLDKIRMGLFKGMNDPEALVGKVSGGLNSLNDLASLENLEAVGGKAPEIEAFNNAREDFLKEFGKPKSGSIDPEELMSFVTNPSSKNSTQQTIAFNHYFKAIKNLSNVKFSDENVGAALRDAQNSLQDWMGELSYSSQVNPYADIEYGAPGATKPYSTAMDLPPGEKITPNFNEGITLPEGSRVSEFGTKSASPFEEPRGFSMSRVSRMIKSYQSEIQSLMEKQEAPKFNASDITNTLEQGQGLGNQVANISKVNEAIQAKPEPLSAGVAIAATKLGIPWAVPLFNAVRNYGGEGGLYRLGNTLASPLKMLEGISNTAQKVDQRIGDKARMIFTAGSAQARPKEKR